MRQEGSALGECWLLEPALCSPEAEGGVADVEDAFAIGHGIPAVFEDFGIVAFGHLVELGVFVADAFDFLAGEVAGAVGDLEAFLGGSVDEVGGGREVGGEVFVVVDELHDFGGGAVAELADEAVDLGVFAEYFHFRCEDDEFAFVGDGHAGAVDGLVAEPGAVEFLGVEVDDHLGRFFVELVEVDGDGKLAGFLEGLVIVPDVESAGDEGTVFGRSDDGEDVEEGKVLAEFVLSVVEDAAERSVGAPHHAFHAVGGADEVAFVDAFHAAGSDEDVLVVVGHADDLVGDDLADGEDEVVAAFPDELVHLGGPGVGVDAVGDVGDKLGGDGADGDDVVAPAMGTDEAVREAGEHFVQLFGGHGDMGAEGGHDIDEGIAVVVVGHAGQRTGPAVEAGEVGRQDEDAFFGSDLVENGDEGVAQVVVAEVGVG